MTALSWDPHPRSYSLGLDRGVFYPQSGPGEAWSGLRNVTNNESFNEPPDRYFDGEKIPRRKIGGSFAGRIAAYTYPDSFYENVLLQKRPTIFGLSYRTQSADRYQIHLVYNVLVAPPKPEYSMSEETIFDWSFSTSPIPVTSTRGASHFIIDTGIAYSWTVAALETVLYGSDDADARLPLPEELMTIIDENAILQIFDNGDGSWKAVGPDEVVSMIDSTSFQIDWPSAVMISSDTYTVYTL